MKLIVCGFCKKKTKNSKYCHYCHNEITKANEASHLLRTIKQAIINDDKSEIDKLSSLYLKETNNNLVNYYYLYANDNNERFSLVFDNEKEIYEALNHQYLHKAKLIDMESFVEAQSAIINKDKLIIFLFNLYTNEYSPSARLYDSEEINRLKYNIEFPETKRKDYSFIKGFALLLISIVSLLGFYFFGIKGFKEEVKFFSTVFSLILPAIFFSFAISIFIIKKINFLISLLCTLIFILFGSYFFLLGYEDSLIKHFIRVFKSIFEFIAYMERTFSYEN